MSATVASGGTQNFAATVTGSFLGVTWSATGGAIVATGSTTARYEAGSTPGTFSVTATSIADPTKSASATISIAAPAGTVRVVGRSGHIITRTHAMGRLGFDGGSVLFDERDDDATNAGETLAPYTVTAFSTASAGDVAMAAAVASGEAALGLVTTATRLLAEPIAGYIGDLDVGG